jgi:hypothetical protein
MTCDSLIGVRVFGQFRERAVLGREAIFPESRFRDKHGISASRLQHKMQKKNTIA